MYAARHPSSAQEAARDKRARIAVERSSLVFSIARADRRALGRRSRAAGDTHVGWLQCRLGTSVGSESTVGVSGRCVVLRHSHGVRGQWYVACSGLGATDHYLLLPPPLHPYCGRHYTASQFIHRRLASLRCYQTPLAFERQGAVGWRHTRCVCADAHAECVVALLWCDGRVRPERPHSTRDPHAVTRFCFPHPPPVPFLSVPILFESGLLCQ